MKKIVVLLFCLISGVVLRAQNPVISENELLEYEIYYAFVTGAKMTLETETVTENGKKLYHLVAKGNTIGLWIKFIISWRITSRGQTLKRFCLITP